MRLLTSIFALLLAASAFAKVPIKDGELQSTLNAGGYSITNVASVTDTNGNPLAGGDTSGLVSTNHSGPVSVTGAVTVVNGSLNLSGNTTLSIGSGTVSPGTSLVAGNWRPYQSFLYDLGDSSHYWRDFWASNGTFTGVVTVGGVGVATTNDTTAVSNAAVAATYSSIRIQRGTNYVPVGTFANLTNLWQAGDVVHLGVTNTLDFVLRVTVPNITFKGLGRAVSSVGQGTNSIQLETNGITFMDVALFGAVSDSYLLSGLARVANIEFLGPMTITNITIRNVDFVHNNCGFAIWPTNQLVGDIAATVENCTFRGGGGWSGARLASGVVSTNSTVLFDRCSFTWSAISGGVTNVRPVALRAESGTVTIRDCYVDAEGYSSVHEQIGIYINTGILRVEGKISWGPFANRGATGVYRMLIEGDSVLYDVGGSLSSVDLHYNGTRSTNNLQVTVQTYLGSNRLDVAQDNARTKIGIDELVITGTNGVSVPTYYFREMPYSPLSWPYTNRSAWWPLIRPFTYASNTFASLTQQTNSAINYTNSPFILSFWATNGVRATNVSGTNWVLTLALNDYLVISNLGERVSFVNLSADQLDSSYVAQSTIPTLVYPDVTLDSSYTNYVGTNYSLTARAVYVPQGMASFALQKFGPGSRYVGVNAVELANAIAGRSLNVAIGLVNTNAALTNNQAGAVSLSDRQFRTVQSTNPIFAIEGISGFANTTFTWSGAAYTNSSGRYLTNNGNYWRGMQGANERYTNANLFGTWSLGANGLTPPMVVIPSGSTWIQGNLTLSNCTFTVVAEGGATVFSQNGTGAIVGGLTNAAGGPIGQAAIANTNQMQATLFKTNSATLNTSVIAEGTLLALGHMRLATNVPPVGTTNGVATFWNSNGVVWLRTSTVGSTTEGTDKQIAP